MRWANLQKKSPRGVTEKMAPIYHLHEEAMTQSNRKQIVEKFFQLIMQGRPLDSLQFFSSECRQHNPYVSGGMYSLLEAMIKAQNSMRVESDPALSVKRILEDEDIVAVHTELYNSNSDLSKGGLRQVHLFRSDPRDKITEYWDITQVLTQDMPEVVNAF
jgi:predicted SnoaL-like aldol condensation-catalyzing enzyme